MKKSVLLALASCLALNTFADDKTIGLAGRWDFGFGDNKVYNDIINLPGSMLTNGKGNDVDADTKWTGSLYDLSYYYSDAMAQYREKGNIKFPFFLTPDKEYVGNAYYRRNVEIPSAWKGVVWFYTSNAPISRLLFLSMEKRLGIRCRFQHRMSTM